MEQGCNRTRENKILLLRMTDAQVRSCFTSTETEDGEPRMAIFIAKSLKTKIAHTVTKGRRHSAGCTCEK